MSATRAATPDRNDSRIRKAGDLVPSSEIRSIHPIPAPATEDGPPCLKCGRLNTVISPGVGPHHARIDCPRCNAWRWAPKPPPRPVRGEAGA
jgi:hypothetical protein